MARTYETDVIEELETARVADGAKEAAPVKAAAPSATPRSFGRWIALVAFVAIAAGTVSWWLNSQGYEGTDDAQIEGHLALVSPRISGTVTYINRDVENNKLVQAGTLLVELDPNDYQADLAHARASLDTSRAEAQSAQVNVPIVNAGAFSQLRAAEAAREQALAAVDAQQAQLSAAQHKLAQDEATAARAERDRARYQSLVEKREISRSDYDARETEAATAAQVVESDRAEIQSRQQQIAQANSLVTQRQAQIDGAQTAPQQVSDARARSSASAGHVEEAQASVRTAQLNLGYTKIYAALTGVVGRKTVELGQRVQPGQSLMAIVPLDDIWITANFKETQLKKMRPGQAVEVHVDSFGRDFTGHVESMPGAAGPVFSLFPPENATGNYVKVVQRFPVRIRFDAGQDPQHLLRPGMSVEPTVTVK